MAKELHATHHLNVHGRGRRRRPHPRAARPVGDLTRARSTATGRCASCLDENGLEGFEIRGRRSLMSRRARPRCWGRWACPTSREMQLDPARTYVEEAPFGSMDPDERLPRLDAEGIDAAVLYTTARLAVGGGSPRPRAVPGLHPLGQPLDLRVRSVASGSSPTRGPVLERSGGGGPGVLERAVGEAARGACTLPAVCTRAPAARPPRQRPRLRRRPGP